MELSDSKAMLHHHLQRTREALVWKAAGLTEREARWPRTPTGTSLIGLVKHAANTEIWYFGDAFGRAWPTPAERVSEEQADQDPLADLYVREDETCAGVVDLYRRVWTFADATIAELPLDATGVVPWWGSEEVTLERLIVHVLVDLARHAGHADILREQLDGVAGLREGTSNLPEGQDWPAYVAKLEGIAEKSLRVSTHSVTVRRMAPRATAMAPDERRKAIVEALIPLLIEKGSEVSTREIAEAAGIAEGTIFRVFPDKKSLMLAAAQEAMNPSDEDDALESVLADAGSLHERVEIVVRREMERMRRTMSVMFAVRHHTMGEHLKAAEKGAETRGKHFAPPAFIKDAQAHFHLRLVGVFTPYAAELAVSPDVAATALRSLIFGTARPELGGGRTLSPEQIAELLLHGIARKVD